MSESIENIAREAAALKPCPFCGGTSIDPHGWASTETKGPACDDCGASAGSTSDSPAKNIEAWNRRALEGERVREDEIRRDEREACAKIARDAALNARLMVDRKEARTAGGTAVLTGYVFAATEAETIAKLITARRVQACLEGEEG